MTLSSMKLAYAVSLDVPGYSASEDYVSVAPGGRRVVQLWPLESRGLTHGQGTASEQLRRSDRGDRGVVKAKTRIEPLVFGPKESPLFGMFTIPPHGIAVDRGVVICAPLGYENVIYHRQLGILARRLAADGRPTLRFDWPGTGDSAGDDRRSGLVEGYIDAVGTAVRTLRDHTEVAEIDVIGLRIGATFAAAAAARGGIAANLVLWAPFTTGRAYVREMRAFQRLAAAGDGTARQSRRGGS